MSFFSKLLGVFSGEGEKKVEKREVREQVRSVSKELRKPKVRDVSGEELMEARHRAKEIVLEAKDEALAVKRKAEEEGRRLRKEAEEVKKKAEVKEEGMERKMGVLEERERQLEAQKKKLEGLMGEAEGLKKEQLGKLEKIALLSREEAKKLILEGMDKYLTEDIAKKIRDAEERAKEESDKKAKEILVDAMKHGATDYVAEYSVSVVKLADEEMKGRIIGKEGRNIRALEACTGVDFDIDETPGEIRLSSFDPVRREIAKRSLEKLMKDGRIQPARIEEVVERTKEEVDKIMLEEGEKLCHEVKVYNLPVELVKLLGRFKYRYSYGQNMIAHTLEETKMGVALGNEVGANVNIIRLGCLLHDIGKAVADEEGDHVQIGVDLLKKNGLPEEVIACVAEHHEDKPFSSIESTVTYIADAISGSRPGARYEDYEEYVERLNSLEEVAKSFKGVKEAYAFSAGRELRVIVDAEQLSDDQAVKLAFDVKKKIEEKVKHVPGNVKITVIREKRIKQTAK